MQQSPHSMSGFCFASTACGATVTLLAPYGTLWRQTPMTFKIWSSIWSPFWLVFALTQKLQIESLVYLLHSNPQHAASDALVLAWSKLRNVPAFGTFHASQHAQQVSSLGSSAPRRDGPMLSMPRPACRERGNGQMTGKSGPTWHPSRQLRSWPSGQVARNCQQ